MCTVYSTRGSLLALQRPVIILGGTGEEMGGQVCEGKVRVGMVWGEVGDRGEIVSVTKRRDKAREEEGCSRAPPTKTRVPDPQQLHVSADGLARSFLSSLIGSGNSLYNSTSVSCAQGDKTQKGKF